MHRLDKLTSGLLIISKNPVLAASFHQELKNKNVEKTYLARVHGKLLTGDAENKEILVNKPIYCVSRRDAKYDVCEEAEKVAKKAKDASTIVKSIWYDEKSDTSLMECRPLTGKTHQIRVHLKSLGHSIVNDTSYGGKFLGNLIMKYMEKQENCGEKIVKKIKLDEKGSEKQIVIKGSNQKEEEKNENIKEANEKNEETNEKINDKNEENENINQSINENYHYSCLGKEEETHVLEIWLHSYKYKFRGVLFSTKMPYWAIHKTIDF